MISFRMLPFFKARSVNASSLGLSSTSSITLLSIHILLHIRQCKVKCCSVIDLAFGTHDSAVAVNDPLNSREPDAGALETCRIVKTLKSAEQFICISHIETGS